MPVDVGLGVRAAYPGPRTPVDTLPALHEVSLPYDVRGPGGEDGAELRAETGEYLNVVLLRDGRLGVMTTVMDAFDDRNGFRRHPIEVVRESRAR